MAKRIRFDRSLYLPDAVDAAVAAYAEHAQIAVTPGDDAVETVISGVAEEDEQDVANAFCNHVLYETIARVRQGGSREVG